MRVVLVNQPAVWTQSVARLTIVFRQRTHDAVRLRMRDDAVLLVPLAAEKLRTAPQHRDGFLVDDLGLRLLRRADIHLAHWFPVRHKQIVTDKREALRLRVLAPHLPIGATETAKPCLPMYPAEHVAEDKSLYRRKLDRLAGKDPFRVLVKASPRVEALRPRLVK